MNRTRLFAVSIAVIMLSLIVFAVSELQNNKEDSSPDVVTIVVSLPRSESFGQALENSVRLALEEHNYKVGETEIELIVLDTSDPERNPDGNPFSVDIERKGVQQAIDNPNVIAYIGPITSDQAKETIPLTNAAGLAHISPSASWPGLTLSGFGAGEPGIYYPTGQRNFFRVAAVDSVQGVIAVDWVSELGFESVYILHDGTTYGSGLAGIFEANVLDSNIEIVGDESYDHTTLTMEEVEEIAVRIVESEADLLYFPANGVNFGLREIITAVKTLDSSISIMGGDSYTNSFVGEIPAEYLEGIFATDLSVMAPNLDSEAGQTLAANYEDTYDSPLTSTTGTGGYEIIGVLIQAIEQAETIDRPGILNALRNMEYQGVYGIWHFNDFGDITPPTLGGMQVIDGEWQFIRVLSSQ